MQRVNIPKFNFSTPKINLNSIQEAIDSKCGYAIWGRPLPITVTYEEESEEIVCDARKAESQNKIKIPDFRNIDPKEKIEAVKTYIREFKLTTETIPNVILLVTGIGILSEILAYFVHIPWYLPVVVFSAVIMGCVLKFKELNSNIDY